MIDRHILRKLMLVEDLPTLPVVMSRILEAIEDEHSSANDLTAILESDHAISARVLRTANSAFYGLGREVDSIRRAVVVIGFDAVRMLALATSVLDAFRRRRQLALDPDDFWMHSLGAAKAAQVLAGKCCPVESPGGCFTAGLLHDIGKHILALTLEEQYRKISETARDSRRALKDIEMEELNTDHADVGGWIVERWCFPATIVDIVRNLYRLTEYTGPCKTETAVVALSSDISRLAGFGHAGDWDERPFDEEVADYLGLPADLVNGIAEDLGKSRDDAREFLDLLGQGTTAEQE